MMLLHRKGHAARRLLPRVLQSGKCIKESVRMDGEARYHRCYLSTQPSPTASTTRSFSSSSSVPTPQPPHPPSPPPPRSPYLDGPDTHFGFESVKIEEKEGRVREVFENVADSYDVMNDLMSGGLHRYWKDTLLEQSAVGPMARAIRQLEQQQQQQSNITAATTIPTLRVLDVAGGTGDVAFRFVEAAGCPERAKVVVGSSSNNNSHDPISVTVCDINAEMLRVGLDRALERYGKDLIDEEGDGAAGALSFVQGNAQDLCNFASDTFDLYTIAFGLRNVTDVDKGLEEAFRVLKPGGRFMCLEFSQVPDPLLRQIYDAYSFSVIPRMGEVVANDRASYQYLVESIRKFSNQDELVTRMEAAGFQLCNYTNLTGGIVAIHEGWKPLG